MNRFKPQIYIVFVASAVLAACGGGGIDSTPTSPVATQIQLLAGHVGGAGNIEGRGSAARFSNPNAAVRAPSGEIYVADTDNHLIRRIDTDGKVSNWAGHAPPAAGGNAAGHNDGERLSAQFNYPSDIALGSDGTMYVADRGNAVIRAISPAGIVRTLAGQVSQPGSIDGVGANAKFAYPVSLLVESSGSLLVRDRDGGLRTVSPQGEVATVRTTLPQGLYLTAAGLDKMGHRLIAGGRNGGTALYRLNGNGNATQLTGDPSEPGTNDGPSASARFGTITSVVEDANGNLLIADALSYVSPGYGRIYPTGGITIRKLSPQGMVSTIAGRGLVSGSTDGDSSNNLLCGPASIKPYDGTTWLLADNCNNTIRLLGPDGQLQTLAGLAAVNGNTNGKGDQARFSSPMGIAITQEGNAYVADFGNSSIRRISTSGQTSLVASITSTYGPTWLTTNGTNELCFVDRPRTLPPLGRSTLRCIGSDGTLRDITNGEKDGVSYYSSVDGLTSDRPGNWLITEKLANALHSVNSSGAVGALTKDFKNLGAITSSEDGTVYLKIGNSVQKRTKEGIQTLVAGSSENAGYQNGIGSEARFGNITALAVDAQHYVYVADWSDTTTITSTIRLISPTGKVSTLAGTQGQSGVRLGNAPGSLSIINGLAVAADQQSLVATTANGVIRITLQR